MDYRKLISGIDTKVPLENGEMVTAINFDNAATTPPFITVLQQVMNFAPWYSSAHRGAGYKSKFSTKLYENSRSDVLNFVNADPSVYTTVFVKNSTEAINKLSFRLCNGKKKCLILSTDMEHHSNDLPWRNKYKVDYISIDEDGRLSMDDLKFKLAKYKGAVRLITVTGASNVTGYVNPIYEIAALAHKYNAKLLVDGSQLVPHIPIDMRSMDSPEHIDYLVFSAHKMYAPFGIGVLIAPKEVFQQGIPEYRGGGTVQTVTHKFVIWDDPPHKEEAGSPNIIGAVALSSAINTLKLMGMDNIQKHELNLTKYTLERLKKIPDIQLYGNVNDLSNKLGIICFNIEGIPHQTTAEILSGEAGIAVRSGCFCAQPYVQRLLNIASNEIIRYARNPKEPRPGLVRISFGLYNTFEEIDILIETLNKIVKGKKHYIAKYSNPS